MAELTLTVGRLLCGVVRRDLERIAFRNSKIRWRESSGWIEREFQIIGPSDDLLGLKKIYQRWFKELNKEGTDG